MLKYYLRKFSEIKNTWIKCSGCETLFPNQEEMKLHADKTHVSNLVENCKICPLSFNTKRGLKRHSIVHFQDPNLDWIKCLKCTSFFETDEELQNHPCQLLNHPSQQPDKAIQCEFCPKLFYYRPEYRRHVIWKHKERIEENWLQCQLCLDYFPSEADLIRHNCFERTKHQCHICQLLCLDRNSLVYHFKSNHSEYADKKVQCCFCPMIFREMSIELYYNHAR